MRDLLNIGTQQRPDLFALNVIKHPVLYTKVLEIDERIGADGHVINKLSNSTLSQITEKGFVSTTQSIIQFLEMYFNLQE